MNFIWSSSAEHGTLSGRNVVTGVLLSGRHVSAADFTSIIINTNSTVIVWVETSSNRSGLYFIWQQKGIGCSDRATGGWPRGRASISGSSGRFFTSPESVDRL